MQDCLDPSTRCKAETLCTSAFRGAERLLAIIHIAQGEEKGDSSASAVGCTQHKAIKVLTNCQASEMRQGKRQVTHRYLLACLNDHGVLMVLDMIAGVVSSYFQTPPLQHPLIREETELNTHAPSPAHAPQTTCK